MNPISLKVTIAFSILLAGSTSTYSQYQISVDINRVLKDVSANSLGMNVNYLMDGSYISAGTPAATARSLKKMGMKILRYPGGEKSDNYQWSSAPFLESNPSTLLTGNCQWPSSDSRFVESDTRRTRASVLDFDEFMVMCRETGAEPMIVCAYDAAYYGGSIEARNPCGIKPTKQQLIENAKEWVRYANLVKGYNVKYWSIGNESWHDCTYNGCVSASQYAADIIEFATAMRSVDPSIKIIANGFREEWWQALLQYENTADMVDYFGVSCYPVNTYTGGYEYYRTNSPDLVIEINDAVRAIEKYASPENKRRIKLLVTETNSVDWFGSWPSLNDVGHALVACEVLGRCFQNTRVESTLFWNTRWTNNTIKNFDLFDVLDKNSGLNANGLMLSLWADAILPRMVWATDEGFVKAFAFHDVNDTKVNTVLINKDNTSKSIELSIPGLPANFACVKWEFAGSGIGDTRPTYRAVDSFNNFISPLSISLPANSITVLKFKSHELLPLPQFEGSLRVSLASARLAVLSWKIRNTGNSIFNVEKSVDRTIWKNIGQVKTSAGSGSQFNFEDGNPFSESNLVYYRIAGVNERGAFFYSDIKSIQQPDASAFSVRLLSNPVEENARFEVHLNSQTLKEIYLIDAFGKLVKKYDGQGVNSNYSFNIKNMSAGVYFFQFISNRSRKTIKVVKL